MRDARLGLAVAIGLGGLVSMAVVLVGSAVDGAFGYAELAAVLADRLGPWAVDLFGWGLFAAGFSSAVTAPWAAAITARGLFADGDDDPAWSDRSPRFRAVWAGVLAFGAVFGLLDVAPIPVILLAQAANGVLLPLVAVVLFLVVNDRRTLGDATNGPIANVLTGAVVVITVALGVRGVLRASATISGRPEIAEAPVAWTATACVVAVVGAWVGREWRAARDPAQGSPSS
ncbi:MAG: divalent metal cation transporter [Acidobacteriota bacterium]